ncbi:unnamed protein product [Mytilus edulis]|uniref:Uncharacterized protein n=1 Tax=Mytilus edulis TaxID=6550 RepID=A0A8S3Q070_MYTED|nr:unnamed protein product [Mytilus edulis]
MEPNLRCSLGSLHQSSSSCGLHPRHPKDTTTVKLSSCNKDIKTHLQNLKLAVGGRCGGLDTHNSEITTEADLLCRSVALFTTNTSLTVCPFHRYTLGLDYRQGKTCLHPDHEGKGKTFRGLSSFQSQRILEEYSLFIPVGSGRFNIMISFFYFHWGIQGHIMSGKYKYDNIIGCNINLIFTQVITDTVFYVFD